MEREYWQVIPAAVGLQARLDAERDRNELLVDELIAERENNRRIAAGVAVETAEWERVCAGLCATIAQRDADLRRVAWALWLDETATALVGALALAWDALTVPVARHVGRTYGPTDRQIAAVAGVLVACALIVLAGLGGW